MYNLWGQACAWEASGAGSADRQGQLEKEAHAVGELGPLCLVIRLWVLILMVNKGAIPEGEGSQTHVCISGWGQDTSQDWVPTDPLK